MLIDVSPHRLSHVSRNWAQREKIDFASQHHFGLSIKDKDMNISQWLLLLALMLVQLQVKSTFLGWGVDRVKMYRGKCSIDDGTTHDP